jgi:NADH oxidase (H2O2-forming)
VHIVIIGNGAAGNSVASIVKKFDHEVTIISEEVFPEYSACALPYYLCGEIPRQHLFLRKQEQYRSAGIHTIFGSKVSGIDVTNQQVIFKDGNLNYDKLVIATGADAMVPKISGIDRTGVFTLKTLEDVDKILAYPKRKIVIIGSGFIGVEAGIALRKKGFEVVFIELLDRILPRAFDKKSADIIELVLREHGIEVLTKERVVQILGKERVEGVETDKRRIQCDVVILSTGMRPRIDLARSAGIGIGHLGGILTNEQMLTNVGNIYACGDCVESRDVVTGRNSLQLIWPNAILQGKIVGCNCVGIAHRYRGFLNVVGIDIFGIHAASVGQTRTAFSSADHINTVEAVYRKYYHVVVVKDGVIIGAQFVGNTRDVGVISQAIRKRLCLEESKKTTSKRKLLTINPLYLKADQIWSEPLRMDTLG